MTELYHLLWDRARERSVVVLEGELIEKSLKNINFREMMKLSIKQSFIFVDHTKLVHSI